MAESSNFVPPKLETKSMSSDVIPIPNDPVDCLEENDRRLWIGNLDTRVTEFALLKILQKFGSLQRFDFLYHLTGPDQGKPRGYCFVSYNTKQEAEKAMKSLDRKLALTKSMLVKWAHKQVDRDVDSVTPNSKLSEQNQDITSADSQIRAIEMKLQTMEKSKDDFSLTTKPLVKPGTSKYSNRKNPGTSQPGSSKHNQNQGTSNKPNKPYYRKDSRR